MLEGAPIFFIGLMGAGKTTLGKLIASELHRPFFDTDEEIELRAGADIPWIFDVEGEQGFREREAHVLEELAEEKNAIISTGGGIVERAENRDVLKRAGYVVYLRADASKLFARVGKDKRRPLLQTSNPRAKLEQLLNRRDPLYQEVADHIVYSNDTYSPKEMARRLVRHIRSL